MKCNRSPLAPIAMIFFHIIAVGAAVAVNPVIIEKDRQQAMAVATDGKRVFWSEFERSSFRGRIMLFPILDCSRSIERTAVTF